MNTEPIRIAIVGVGNCASALVQGIHRARVNPDTTGLMEAEIGGWGAGHVEVVAAFDIDKRKVGRSLHDALAAKPNCALIFHALTAGEGPTVQMGPVLDGCAAHMADHPEEHAFRVADFPAVDVAQALRDAKVDVMLSYLPVGSDEAVEHYAQAAVDAGCAMVNCSPCFIASNPEWRAKFEAAGCAIIGDDIKSQFGATFAHRALVRAMGDRGINILRTYQLNIGGNTDFMNMLDRGRLASKKLSKTEAVQSQLDGRLVDSDIHVGPSDYVPWLNDNKVATVRIEAEGFGGVPMTLDLRLSVQDSPNSAGVVIDAIRLVALAKRKGISGVLDPSSAWLMKHPPVQMRDEDARKAVGAFIATGELATAK